MHRGSRTLLVEYAVALAGVALAVLLRRVLDPWLEEHLTLVTLYGAVALAVWVGGYRPAALAAAGYLACDYLFIEPRGVLFFWTARSLIGLLAYALSCAIIIGFGEALRDARRRAEAAAEAAAGDREWLRATLSSVGDAVITTDARGYVTFLNPLAQSLTGWNLSEAVGQPLEAVFEIVNEQTREPAEAPVAKVLREGVVVGLANHTILLARDGSERVIDDSAAPIKDGHGRVQGVILVFRDVTEKRRAERAVQESEARKAAILQSALDAIITMDHEGKILEFNPAAEALFGYRRDEVAGRKLADLLVPPALRDEYSRGLSRYLAMGDGPVLGGRVEMPALRADGKELLVELAVTAIPRDGPPVFTAHLRDVTDRAKAERRRSARLAVTQILAEAATVREAAPRILQSLCESLGWDAGTLWRLDPQAGVLRCADFWRRPGAQAPAFEALTRQRAFETGVGLPGRVWASGRPVWIPDVRQDGNFPRAATAAGEGLHAAFGFPVLLGSEFLGVIEFFSHAIREPDADLLEMMATIGGQVGQFLERRRAEDALRKQNERLRLLWEAASVLLSTDEPDAMMRALFARLAPHFGLDAYFNYVVNESGDGLRVESCLGIPEDAARAIARLGFGQAICGTVAQTRRAIVATHIQRSDDPKVQLVKRLGLRAYACNPLLAGDRLLGTLSFASRSRDEFDEDELEFLRTICRYVTAAYERLRLIGQLREADRRKDEFLATLAHELRNPLAPIRNGLEILRLAGGDAEAVAQVREVMVRQLAQMVRLIDDLLDVSRITRGKLELRRERVELAAVVSSAVETSRPLIEAAGHELSVTLPPSPVYLDADPTRLAQVFANLLNNAAKFTEPGGRISLSAGRRGSEVVVSVRDNGIGIPADRLPRLFEMFSQVTPALERSRGGLGIGLSLVKGLVEMHGGSVEARSGGGERGSEFLVRLPVLPEAAAESPDRAGEPEAAPREPERRVLVVDDLRDTAESLALLLRLRGHDVRTAHDGLEAVAAAESFRPDVVLLDIGLPKLNGYEACRRIRGQPWGRGMAVVAVTGWGQEEDRRRASAAGFDLHLTKPVNPAALERLLAELPRRRQAALQESRTGAFVSDTGLSEPEA